jgi:hypothetical protein
MGSQSELLVHSPRAWVVDLFARRALQLRVKVLEVQKYIKGTLGKYPCKGIKFGASYHHM